MRRTQPTTKQAKISSITNVQLLQKLHGKQQQQININMQYKKYKKAFVSKKHPGDMIS